MCGNAVVCICAKHWFRVRVVMPDGTHTRFVDCFTNGFDAIECGHFKFPDAKRVSALCLGGHCA